MAIMQQYSRIVKMIVLIVLCLLFTITNNAECTHMENVFQKLTQALPERGYLQDLVVDTAECIRQHLINGNPELNLPSFDPLEIERIQPDFANISHVEGNVILTDLYLDGIPTFNLTDINTQVGIIPPRATIEFLINIDRILLEVFYDGAISLFNFLDLFGNGKIELDVENVRIPVRVVQGLLDLQDASITLEIGDVQVSATGLLNDDYLSGLIGNSVQDIVQTILNQYSDTINETLTSTLINLLGGKGALELIGIITGIKDSCNNPKEDGGL